MEVTLINSMGSDLDVVNAARVSFNKESNWEIEGISVTISDKDKKLIKYLAEHDHFTPFTHCTATFRIKAPIFVMRQLMKSQVGLSVNEISRRYVDDKPEFYIPNVWRGKPKNKKQGSSDIEVNWINNDYWEGDPKADYKQVIEDCESLYQCMIYSGIAPEQARMILPMSLYSEMYWTGSLYAFSRVCNLRLGSDAQEETTEIARMINKECKALWSVSWKELVG